MDTTMLKMIAFLNDLAHDSLNGFEEISDWNKMEPDKVLYDKSTVDEVTGAYALMVSDNWGINEPKNADTVFPGVKFGVVDLNTGKAVSVKLNDSDRILVKDGRWYFES